MSDLDDVNDLDRIPSSRGRFYDDDRMPTLRSPRYSSSRGSSPSRLMSSRIDTPRTLLTQRDLSTSRNQLASRDLSTSRNQLTPRTQLTPRREREREAVEYAKGFKLFCSAKKSRGHEMADIKCEWVEMTPQEKRRFAEEEETLFRTVLNNFMGNRDVTPRRLTYTETPERRGRMSIDELSSPPRSMRSRSPSTIMQSRRLNELPSSSYTTSRTNLTPLNRTTNTLTPITAREMPTPLGTYTSSEDIFRTPSSTINGRRSSRVLTDDFDENELTRTNEIH
jgi:hypothetical protein